MGSNCQHALDSSFKIELEQLSNELTTLNRWCLLGSVACVVLSMLILVLSTSLLCALPPLSFVLVLAFAVGFSCITTLPLYLAAKFGEKRELKEVEGINTQIKCLDSLNDEGKSLFSSNSDSYSYYDTTDAESNVRRVVQLTKQNAPQSKTELRDRFFKQEDASTSLSDQVQTAFNSLPPHKEPRGYYIILNRQFPVKMLGGVTD